LIVVIISTVTKLWNFFVSGPSILFAFPDLPLTGPRLAPSPSTDAQMDSKTYPEWQKGLLSSLVATTKAASAVAGHDVSFERSIDSTFDAALTTVTERLLSLTNQMLKLAGIREDEFEDEDDIEERWVQLVDVVDGLLEKAVIIGAGRKF
jgi:PMC2NT (NUC016) domain